ncbi:hypothetical protein [Minwuia sp.]|uniref:hypothetical protein n=1 Tax=Minwuia sp. TaxID=2493630 RepID=UPI003A93E526
MSAREDQAFLDAAAAQADLHHQYLLGLELMVASREGPEVIGEWMFCLFRSQHEAKFLSSFRKLGLEGQPDAVACARYHVLSNGIGGVGVEYMEESDRKAWVRFRYPRWMYDGAAICGVPVEASRGFLRGWYAQNGVSLKNPRLGFVCVSEDMTAQFGFCGYFREYDHDLTEDERLQFRPDELPPPFDPDAQPAPPATDWNPVRLAKAERNYACEYIRNGIRELTAVLGRERAVERASLAARLTGLQQFPRMAAAVGNRDAGPGEAADFLAKMFRGMGDEADVEVAADGTSARVTQTGHRIARDLPDAEADVLLACWNEIWVGAVHSCRDLMDVAVTREDGRTVWEIGLRR